MQKTNSIRPTFAGRSIAATVTMLVIATHVPAQAHYFCVITAADLQNALNDASDGGMFNDEDNMLELGPGNFNTANNSGQRFYYYSSAQHYLDIEGGWADSCTNFVNDPTQSVLDGHNDSPVLDLRSTQGSITVRNLTIQNGRWQGDVLAAGLTINPVPSDPGFVGVSNTIIRNNQSLSTPGGMIGGVGGIFFFNNLVIGNITGADAGAAEIFAAGSTYVTNNTIVANTTTTATGAGGLLVAGTAAAYLSNNIVWGNSNVDIELSGDAVALLDNDYGSLGGNGSPTPGSAGNISLDPRFRGAGDYHLAGTSPLLAVGTANPPGGPSLDDLEGNSRPQSGLVDLGAYEETVFTSGFDGN